MGWGSFLDCTMRAWPLKTGGGQWRRESWNCVYLCGLCCGCVNSGDQRGNVSSALRTVEVAAMAAWELICVCGPVRTRLMFIYNHSEITDNDVVKSI